MHNFRTIIFDLAEVIIAGLVNVEPELGRIFGVPPETVANTIRGEIMDDYCRGRMTEDEYWRRTMARGGWPDRVDQAKAAVRRNFHSPVPGTEAIIRELAGTKSYRVCLLSDHGREWIDYILPLHPVLGLLDRRFFSFDLGAIKRERVSFERVLAELQAEPGECVFIDDNQQNVEVARSVGITPILFTGAPALRADLARLGIPIVCETRDATST